MLIILFVYTVLGATIRLGTLLREGRLQINPMPATVLVEHADDGSWLKGGVLVSILIAFTYSYLAAHIGIQPGDWYWVVCRLFVLCIAELGPLLIYLRLLKVRGDSSRIGVG